MKKILVIADKTGEKQIVLSRALTLLDNNKGSLTLVGFCYINLKGAHAELGGSISEKKLKQLLIEQRTKELEKAVAELNVKDIAIKIKVVWEKHIAQWVTEHVKTTQYDCVIKSGHRSESWLHTPTDWQLFHDCPIPVLVVANKSWKKKARVLVAVDLASTKPIKQRLNEKLILEAMVLCKTLGAQLHLVYALEVPRVLSDLDLMDVKKFIKNKRKEVDPVLNKLCNKYGFDQKVIHIKSGEPHRIVPSIANELKADIVVAGTVNRRGVSKLIGRTAEGILSKLFTDIYVVKP